MSDTPLTASAIMSFCQRLEDHSAALYAELATRFPEQGKLFEGLSEDCGKHKTQIVRTYQETVTDALETNYSFEGLQLPVDALGVGVSAASDLNAAVSAAISLEERAIAFYEEVAVRSESLLATIPRAFNRVARRRQRRKETLIALLS
jgi:rubrerythrin